jgi:hypothetical protein
MNNKKEITPIQNRVETYQMRVEIPSHAVPRDLVTLHENALTGAQVQKKWVWAPNDEGVMELISIIVLLLKMGACISASILQLY